MPWDSCIFNEQPIRTKEEGSTQRELKTGGGHRGEVARGPHGSYMRFTITTVTRATLEVCQTSLQVLQHA